MGEIADRYRRRAEDFERKVAAVQAGQWSSQSPCAAWTARGVVDHVVAMHEVMLQPVRRGLNREPAAASEPVAAFRAARAAVEAVLGDPRLAKVDCDTPAGRMTVEEQIDRVVSDDLVVHTWDLARATDQDDTMHPDDVTRLWSIATGLPAEVMEKYRTPGALRPGVEVYGPEVYVDPKAPRQNRLLGLIGRDPAWARPSLTQ